MKKVLIVYMVVLVLGTWGYVANIVKLCRCDFKSPVKTEVIRAVGVVVAPMGSVCGFLDINDNPGDRK